MKHITFTAITVVLLGGLSFGQDPPGIPDDVVKNLDYFVGTWQLEGDILGDKITGTSTFRWSRGKHCLTENTVVTAKDERVVRTGIVGWDASRNQIVHGTFMSNGDAFILRYSEKPNNVFEGETVAVLDGKEVKGMNKYVKIGTDRVEYEASNEDGGTVKIVMTKMLAGEGKKKRKAKTAKQ